MLRALIVCQAVVCAVQVLLADFDSGNPRARCSFQGSSFVASKEVINAEDFP